MVEDQQAERRDPDPIEVYPPIRSSGHGMRLM